MSTTEPTSKKAKTNDGSSVAMLGGRHHEEQLLLTENKRLLAQNERLREENKTLLSKAAEHDTLLKDAFATIRSLLGYPDERMGWREVVKKIWCNLESKALKTDPELLLGAIQNGLVEPSNVANDVPEHLRQSSSILDALIEAQMFRKADASILEQFPLLKEKRQFWVEVLRFNAPVVESFPQVIVGEQKLPSLCNDVELIAECAYKNALRGGHLSAIFEGSDEQVLTALATDPCFRHSEEFVRCAIKTNWNALSVVPHEVQAQFSDKLCRWLKTTNRCTYYTLFHPTQELQIIRLIAPQLWKQRPFVVNWFRHRNGSPDGTHLDEFRYDAEFWKDVFCFSFDQQWDCYFERSERSTGRATIPEKLADDFDVKICVLANSIAWREMYGVAEKRNKMISDCAPRARKKLRAYDGFFKAVLPGMSLFSGDKCSLKRLVVDPDTTQAIKLELAEYLDVPLKMRERRWLDCVVYEDDFPEGDGEEPFHDPDPDDEYDDDYF